jgi:hypothetical protein
VEWAKMAWMQAMLYETLERQVDLQEMHYVKQRMPALRQERQSGKQTKSPGFR